MARLGPAHHGNVMVQRRSTWNDVMLFMKDSEEPLVFSVQMMPENPDDWRPATMTDDQKTAARERIQELREAIDAVTTSTTRRVKLRSEEGPEIEDEGIFIRHARANENITDLEEYEIRISPGKDR